jgi:hypothetical protein
MHKVEIWFVILWQHGKYVLMTFCVMVGPFTLANKLAVLFESWEKDMLMQYTGLQDLLAVDTIPSRNIALTSGTVWEGGSYLCRFCLTTAKTVSLLIGVHRAKYISV